VTAGAHYSLICSKCGLCGGDDGLSLRCSVCGDSSLLRTEYNTREFTVSPDGTGIFRYRRWLPVRREIPGSSRPLVYRSRGLGKALGLTDLWIAFSGYWPERGCHMISGTFKELEAYSVLGRIPEGAGVMVVASAGNTAASFAVACRDPDFFCVLVIPERALPALTTAGDLGEGIRVVALEGGTYNDAISFAERMVRSSSEFFFEGGVRNVGRRDGLAVVALTAYEEMGSIPDVYVQAVGSGAGAVATYEAAQRIATSTGANPGLPRLLLCQNDEFAPIHRAWNELQCVPSDRSTQHGVYAPELVNAAPPFSVHGGVRHVLTRSSGDVLVADRASAESAAAMFEELEGIDIAPAAAVAVACLRDAVTDQRVPADARILLNITGGGRRRMPDSTTRPRRQPMVSFVSRDTVPEVIGEKLLRSIGTAPGAAFGPSPGGMGTPIIGSSMIQ
jgi:cysteate synthase